MSYTRPYGNQASSPWAAGAPPGVPQQPAAAMTGYAPQAAYAQPPPPTMYGHPHMPYDQGAQWMPVMRQPWASQHNYDAGNYLQQRMPRSLSAPRANTGTGNNVLKRPNQNWNDAPLNKRQTRMNGEVNNNNYNNVSNINNNNNQHQARRSQQQRQTGQNRSVSQTRGPNVNGNVNSTNNSNSTNNNNNVNNSSKAYNNKNNSTQVNNKANLSTNSNTQNNRQNSKQNTTNNNNNNNNINNTNQQQQNRRNKKQQQVSNNTKQQQPQQQTKVVKKQQPTTTTKIDGAKTKQVKKIIVRKIVKKAQGKTKVVVQDPSKPLSKNAEKRQNRLEARKNSESLEGKNYPVVKSDDLSKNDKGDEPQIPAEHLRYVPAVFGFCCKLCDVFVKDRFLRAEHISSETHQAKFKIAEEARLEKEAEEKAKAELENDQSKEAESVETEKPAGEQSTSSSTTQNDNAPDSAEPSQ